MLSASALPVFLLLNKAGQRGNDISTLSRSLLNYSAINHADFHSRRRTADNYKRLPQSLHQSSILQLPSWSAWISPALLPWEITSETARPISASFRWLQSVTAIYLLRAGFL